MTSVKLSKLVVEEVSGVDRPASMLDGWLVCKARDGTIPILTKALAGFDPEALLVEIAKANTNHRRGDDGRYRLHVPSVTDSPAPAPEDDPTPAVTAKGSIFKPARDVYRRIW